ncbi:MAG: Asp-tRNA(Asn)/Glu-tRNA(Gln) amidotransferase subunit GatB [Dehalococcoidales bacterium]|nr:Asp-tRNA(Asn)/Glu-tRNA(Gln) amidotransferase subunit GatB [Dehalococcoidales bacterium]
MKYETVIGLEVHAQLLTRSKMYCSCSADYASAPPNTHVCPVCLGMPGVLPVINKQAVEYTIMTALALNCPVADYTRFDRKNYPYPDLMKGYQISQAYAPISKKGYINIDVEGMTKRIGINHIHLEEDVAKLIHRNIGGEDCSLVDVNRSGVPLMEIVSEPDLRSAEEARQYLIKLHSILQYLGISTGNMEEGAFRCDANISIRPVGSTELGSKVEVKNLNSFKAVFLAMEYEAKRQRKAINDGKKLLQETRGWVEAGGKTVTQRSKEYAHDYRYFPEPDLPPVTISRDWVEEVRKKLPEMPEARRDRFMDEYNLPKYDADLLTGSKAMADYFEEGTKVRREVSPKEVANWLLGEVSRIINAGGIDIEAFRKKVGPDKLSFLISSSHSAINTATAKSVLEEMFNSGRSAAEIIRQRGLSQISDTGELEKIVEEVIKSNVQPVADYKAGKETAFKFLVGQVMRASKGRANPQLVNQVLKKKLAEA